MPGVVGVSQVVDPCLGHTELGERDLDVLPELGPLFPLGQVEVGNLLSDPLEQDGIVLRTVHNTIPPHVEYSFTKKGYTLGPILDAMEKWGDAHRPRRRGRSEA